MALWKIEAKNNWNWGKGKELVKGMFVEMSTPTTTPPLTQAKNQEAIALLFNNKYGKSFDKSKMNGSHFECIKIGQYSAESRDSYTENVACYPEISLGVARFI